jgi:hypothetical protein
MEFTPTEKPKCRVLSSYPGKLRGRLTWPNNRAGKKNISIKIAVLKSGFIEETKLVQK